MNQKALTVACCRCVHQLVGDASSDPTQQRLRGLRRQPRNAERRRSERDRAAPEALAASLASFLSAGRALWSVAPHSSPGRAAARPRVGSREQGRTSVLRHQSQHIALASSDPHLVGVIAVALVRQQVWTRVSSVEFDRRPLRIARQLSDPPRAQSITKRDHTRDCAAR